MNTLLYGHLDGEMVFRGHFDGLVSLGGVAQKSGLSI